MRTLLTLAFAAVTASIARAQDTDPRLHQFVRFYAGTATKAWKVSAPTVASDHFNVDFASSVDGKVLTALLADAYETAGLPGTLQLGVYENCAPGVPNLSAALTTRTGSVPAGDAFQNDNSYSLACPTAGSPASGYSATVTFPSGDSHTWLGSDSTGGSGTTSFFTTTSYAGCTTIPFSGVDLHVALGVQPGTALLVNGGPSARVEQYGGRACLVFHGPAPNTPGILYLLSPVMSKILALSTDGLYPGPCPNSWALCSTFSCQDPAPSNFTFGHFYFDLTDRKPNGRPRIELVSATLGIDSSGACAPIFGQRDDCILDGNIWKVGNPAGPSDWFNVNHGLTDGLGVSNVTGVELSSWDFCGTGPSWAEVGIYPSSPLDPCIPDLANPVSSVKNTSMAPNAGDWGCPSTFYNLPFATLSTGTIYHVAAKWQTGDSCVWMGSDSDGTDSSHATPIPNNGCLSLFTLDDYSVSRVHFTAANWMMQIEWN